LAFLRHNLSSYDQRLRERCEHDPGYRDALYRQIEEAARAQYRWLAHDPRPFPINTSQSSRFFDHISQRLADLHTLCAQLESAARDLRRSGASKEQIDNLRSEADQARREIKAFVPISDQTQDRPGHQR
jgi:hypothetical protein